MTGQPHLINLPPAQSLPANRTAARTNPLTPAQEDLLQKHMFDLEAFDGVPVRWKKASERRLWDMFSSLMAWALAGSASSVRGGEGGAAAILARHSFDIFLERFLAIRRWLDEVEAETGQARSQEELQAALTRLARRQQQIQRRLSNVEVCVVMMELSLRAPLSRRATAEYMRAFAHVYGVETYLRCNATGQDFHRLDAEACRQLRWSYGLIRRRFPALDEIEIAWMEDFNRRCREHLDRLAASS